jgi:hypothetical protein
MHARKLSNSLVIFALLLPVLLIGSHTLTRAAPAPGFESSQAFQSCQVSPHSPATTFTVTHIIPANAALDVALDATIDATFSQPISSSTVSTRTFTVRGNQTGVYAGTYGGVLSGTLIIGTVQFDPAQNFKPGEEIVVNLGNGMQAANGTLLTPYAWQFRATVLGGSNSFFASDPGMDSTWSEDLRIGDLDGDGDLDIFVAHRDEASTVWFNDGTGTFSTNGIDLGSAFVIGIALGDLDGDSDLDVFFANIDANTVWLNEGTGIFSDSGQSLGCNEISYDVALGDVDGDGDLDAFVANLGMYTSGRANDLWLNDGVGIFSKSSQSLGESHSTSVALGDLDNDGDLDAFVANRDDQANKVWLNDGLGAFSEFQSLGSEDSESVALGDLDGDGDLDAFVANGSSQGNTVWLNDGTGAFVGTQGLGRLGYTSLGDVDGDGDLDAFVAKNGANTVWLNDGNGIFSHSGQSLGSADSQRAALGDVDGDGDLDAFVANHNQVNIIWLNQRVYGIYLPMMLRNFQ